MKITILTFFILLLHYGTSTAQYDNPPTPIFEKEIVEEKEIFIGTFITPSLPYLTSCEGDSSDCSLKKSCSDKKLLHYIYSNVEYPDSAIVNGIEGTVVLSFLVKKDGWIDPKSIKLLRDIGHGCGEEGLKIVQSFNKELGQWSFFSAPEDIRYNLPIRFRFN